jgi:hypothetical protein
MCGLRISAHLQKVFSSELLMVATAGDHGDARVRPRASGRVCNDREAIQAWIESSCLWCRKRKGNFPFSRSMRADSNGNSNDAVWKETQAHDVENNQS